MDHARIPPAALTIAGSDSGGGAGIQADLKTFAALGVYGASVITAITAQNTLGVQSVGATEPGLVEAQLSSVLGDLRLGAIKTGMLGSAESIHAIADQLAARAPDIPLVMDPVMVATSGSSLADGPTIEAMRHLMARATLVTPNLEEAAALTGISPDSPAAMRDAGRALLECGCTAVLIKGGHGSGPEISDLLVTANGERSWSHRALPGSYHGTGCTLASAVAAGLALGNDLERAVERGIGFVQKAMKRGGLSRSGELVLLGHNL